MLFDEKKIDVVNIDDLLQCPIASVKPYALMLAPVYVLMKRNEKLVSVKAPLDFFTPEELQSLNVHNRFFMPQFVKSVVRFQTAAKIVKNLLKPNSPQVLFPAPYEISNEMLNIIGPLWGKNYRIEQFFASVFSDELCGPLNPEKMLQARESAVVRHDHGILLSGILVFVLLQLGWHDLDLMTEIRNDSYARTVDGENWENPTNVWESISFELLILIKLNIALDRKSLLASKGEWAKKIIGRIKRLEKIPALNKYASLSIYGPEGFAT